MIPGLDKMFQKAEIISELEKRSEVFEKTLLDSIHTMEAISLIIDNSKKIYENSAIRNVLSEQDHVALATNFAANQITWSDMTKIAEMHDNLRKLYTEIYKKDAVTAASSKISEVSLEKDKDGKDLAYFGTSQTVPLQLPNTWVGLSPPEVPPVVITTGNSIIT